MFQAQNNVAAVAHQTAVILTETAGSPDEEATNNGQYIAAPAPRQITRGMTGEVSGRRIAPAGAGAGSVSVSAGRTSAFTVCSSLPSCCLEK